jgi:hypothetical protein
MLYTSRVKGIRNLLDGGASPEFADPVLQAVGIRHPVEKRKVQLLEQFQIRRCKIGRARAHRQVDGLVGELQLLYVGQRVGILRGACLCHGVAGCRAGDRGAAPGTGIGHGVHARSAINAVGGRCAVKRVRGLCSRDWNRVHRARGEVGRADTVGAYQRVPAGHQKIVACGGGGQLDMLGLKALAHRGPDDEFTRHSVDRQLWIKQAVD